jgi:hypothetical protein
MAWLPQLLIIARQMTPIQIGVDAADRQPPAGGDEDRRFNPPAKSNTFKLPNLSRKNITGEIATSS